MSIEGKNASQQPDYIEASLAESDRWVKHIDEQNKALQDRERAKRKRVERMERIAARLSTTIPTLYCMLYLTGTVAAGIYALASADWKHSNDALLHLALAFGFFSVPFGILMFTR